MDKLSERLDDLEARVAALEELCALMNEEITSMQTVISALEEGLYITDVREVGDGYLIEFSNGDTITIRHGEDGEDGADGVTPVVGIAQDDDGIYYWTLNGDWLLDENGNKVPAQGRDGVDGEDGQDGTDGKDGDSFFSSVVVGDEYVTFTLADGMYGVDLYKPDRGRGQRINSCGDR